MASVTTGLSNLLSSLLDILSGIFNGAVSGLQSIVGLAQNIVTSIFDLMSGFVGFVLGNIVIIGVLVATYVGYSAYRQKHQGGGVTARVKSS